MQAPQHLAMSRNSPESRKRERPLTWIGWLAAVALLAAPAGASAESFDRVEAQFRDSVQPLLKQFCLDCHSTEIKEGQLDLERFAGFADVRRDPAAWQKVEEMLGHGEMPPEDSPQPSAEQRQALLGWVRQYLDAEARANAGDPGPVLLRRLNNAEYTYTIRDLIGVELNPAAEFPADSAAGEGFTNTGNALGMSPALVTKYLDAAKLIAGHAVLLPDGIRFSARSTRRDWTNEILNEIRSIYLRHTGRIGDANALNRWNVPDPLRLTEQDGRVNLEPYFAALIRHRDRISADPAAAAAVAAEEGLNPKYTRLIADMLLAEGPKSLLLDRLRAQWRTAQVEDAPEMGAEIRNWQDRLWKFNPVGHFGQVKGWQEPVSPTTDVQDFRLKLPAAAKDLPASLFLVSQTAGDGNRGDVVVWENPRFERPGRPAMTLRDLRTAALALDRVRAEALTATSRYLAAAFEARTAQPSPTIAELGARHNLRPDVLEGWLAFLGIAHGGAAIIEQHLTQRMEELAGYSFVKGWTLNGQPDLSVISNASDDLVRVPGDLKGHSIAVHPRPERTVAAGWQSPSDVHVNIVATIQHAHPQCGNGVTWSLEHRRGSIRRVLASGAVELGKAATAEPEGRLEIQTGDLVSLIIGPRDGNHGCDLTQIDLTITEIGGQGRNWSLASDCADTITDANPHSDSYGHVGVWHFYTEPVDPKSQQPPIPPGSLVAQWLEANDAAAAAQIASRIERFLLEPPKADAPAAEAELHRQLVSLNGPLFARIDVGALASQVTPQELEGARLGVDPRLFGKSPKGSPAAADQLVVQAPSIVEIPLPAELVAGSEFVASGRLDSASDEGSVQLQVTAAAPNSTEELLPGVPIVVRAGGEAARRFETAFDEFRNLFPAAMCYARIVPVDTTVTLVLFHREDHELSRLMLDDAEAQRLDRLWDELHYVSQDAFTIVTAFEQLMEFATQDDDPRKYAPLREPIQQQAAAFAERLRKSEPAHLDAVVDFAARAYRRPLSKQEISDLRELYAELRDEGLPHDEAIRLVLARILTAPAFLYRIEQPPPGKDPGQVSSLELASRLSYFLWSSLPDVELASVAASGRLADDAVLLEQTRRMLRDDKVRRLAIEFACQWFHIRDFHELDEKSEQHFPEFKQLRGDMYEESIRYFQDLFQNNRSILEILDSDHTVLNEALARFYGIPGVEGDEWRVVDGVARYSRGGILGQAAMLAKQSGASRTSPILRGNWIAETLLGERLPRPPKNVPQLPEDESQETLTVRQLVEKHTSDPACAKCHVRIDPYGFALERFDAIGRFRDTDLGNRPIDTHTILPDGTPVEGAEGLRTYLSQARRETFVRQFCRKLLGYALGRSVQLSDEPLLADMQKNLAAHDYRFQVAVETIVQSPQFRNIRGADAPRE